MQSVQDFKEVYMTYHDKQSFLRSPQSLYEPFDYILHLGGKRIRPLLLVTSTSVFNGPMEKALPAAYAVELFHNFSLIHDDIMDQADLRRGKETIHKKFGKNTAILSGDAMLIYAYQYLLKSQNKEQLIELMNQTAIEVCEGQQMDMDFESTNDVTIDKYITMIRLKTAVLLGAALKMGAIISDTSPQNQKAIYDFGVQLGISFQIKDDLLDLYGDENFGKKIGGDIVQNKKTLLTLSALEDSSAEDRTTLLHWLNNEQVDEQEKIEAVKEIFSKYNIKEKAEEQSNHYYTLSLESLAKIQDVDTSTFKQFAQDILKRSV